MAKDKIMLDLFEKQLQNLFNSEALILKALPRMLEYTDDDKLSGIIYAYTQETFHQKKRLEEIGNYLKVKVHEQDGKMIRALLEDVEWLYQEFPKGILMNAGLVSKLQHIQHFQISAYETALLYAKNLGIKKVADKLNETLDEAYEADEDCTQYANELLLHRTN